MTDINRAISERLKTIQKEHKLTQRALAVKCGLSANTISKASTGKGISIGNAKMIANAFDVTLDYIFGNSDVKNTDKYAKQTALDAINRHIRPSISSYSFSRESRPVKVVEMSDSLQRYFQEIYEIETTDVIRSSDGVREQLLQEADKKFLNVMQEDVQNSQEYALVSPESLNDEILDKELAGKDKGSQ